MKLKTVQIIVLSTLLWLGCGQAFAAQQSITLQDGSVVHGEVIALNNGVYRIKSEALGTIELPQSQIVSIHTGQQSTTAPISNTAPTGSNSTSGDAFQAIQNSILSDPQMMKSIEGLVGDPQIQELAEDPAVIEAVQSGNYGALLDNPKIKALMQNSKVKRLMEQLQ